MLKRSTANCAAFPAMYGCPKTGVTEAPTVRRRWCNEFNCSAIQHSVLLFSAIDVSVCVDFLTRGLILAIRHSNRWRGEPPEIRAANRAHDSPEIAVTPAVSTRSIHMSPAKHVAKLHVKSLQNAPAGLQCGSFTGQMREAFPWARAESSYIHGDYCLRVQEK